MLEFSPDSKPRHRCDAVKAARTLENHNIWSASCSSVPEKQNLFPQFWPLWLVNAFNAASAACESLTLESKARLGSGSST